MVNMLGKENFDRPIQIDRAHRSPQALGDGRCQAFIAEFITIKWNN